MLIMVSGPVSAEPDQAETVYALVLLVTEIDYEGFRE